MAIFHGVEPIKNFGKVPHEWNRDSTLTMAENGLLGYLKSHRSGYPLTVEQMVAQFADGKDAVRATINGLIAKGYVRREYERERGRVVAVHYLVIGADGEFPQVTATSGKTGTGPPGSGWTGEDAEFSQVGTTSGKTSSGSASSGGSAPKKNKVKKTTKLEDQEDQRTELNWRTADASREMNDDLPSLTNTSTPAAAAFTDWRPGDYDLFQSHVGAGHMTSDGEGGWNPGTWTTLQWYQAFRQRAKNPLQWPGAYFEQMSNNEGVGSYLASQGLEPDFSREDAA